MKTKQRTEEITLPGGVRWYVKPLDYPTELPQGPNYVGDSTISYAESLSGTTGRNGKSRPVLHTKVKVIDIPIPADEYLPPPANAKCLIRPTWVHVPSSGRSACISLAQGHSHAYLSDSDWRDLDQYALSKMLPNINKGSSVINFLLELKDFKFIFSRHSTVKERILKVYRDLKSKDRDKTLSTISNGYLFNEFALQPLIGDVINMYKDVVTFYTRVNELKRRAGSWQKRYFTKNLDGSYPSTNQWETVTAGTFGSMTWNSFRQDLYEGAYRQYLQVPVYRATVRYRYTLKTPDVSMLRLQLDALGVRLDPSILWNAVPFTFIVDWFVNVSNFLEQFARDSLGTTIEIADFCSSVKAIVQYTHWVWHREFYLFRTPRLTWGAGTQVAHAQSTYYERRVNRINIFDALKLSGLNMHEAALTAALYQSGAFNKKSM